MKIADEHIDDIDLNPRIAYLVHLYIFEALTNSQREELEEWINESDYNREIFSQATNPEELKRNLELLESLDTDQQLLHLKSTIDFGEIQRSPRIHWSWKVAACAIIIIGIWGIYYWVKDSTPALVQGYIESKDGEFTNLNPPGRNEAILDMKNFSITLDSADRGFITSEPDYAVLNENGHVKYLAASTTHTKENELINHQISTQCAGTYSMILSDGTKVWLNPSSSISFPPVFSSKERRVTITGEIFFEVAKATLQDGGKKPFIVDVKNRDVRMEVLGAGCFFGSSR